MASHALITIELASDRDVVVARNRARLIAELLGFDGQDQVRIGTAVSELARNAVRYAGGGALRFVIDEHDGKPALTMQVADRGPGIAALQSILDGEYRSTTGMGIGLTGTRRLMDRFDIASAPGRGTTVVIGKRLPPRAPITAAEIARLGRALAMAPPEDPIAEVTRQNQELLRVLADLRQREEELVRLNRELEDTNRGVVALYAELDQRATDLKQASEVKTRFFSFMSHEFRTPVNSILALTRMLADRVDGPLTDEQDKQVGFIRRSAEGLAELVDDLLDIAKVEAGRVTLRIGRFTVEELFGALKGALRPLLPHGAAVTLAFVAEPGLPPLDTDESKLAQILRNLVSNALKFTERGEVRVHARQDGAGLIEFAVSDTGIGIAPEHFDAIFREFGQIDGQRQRSVKGTGLGLPLSRKLAALLGGTLAVRSAPGEGSVFTLAIPPRCAVAADDDRATAPDGDAEPADRSRRIEAPTTRILLIDDDSGWRYVLRGLLGAFDVQVFEAENGADGLDVARVVRPQAIVLDLAMPVLDGFQTFAALREDPELATIPVIVCSSRELSAHERERLSGVAAVLDKTSSSRDADVARLRGALAGAGLAVEPAR